MTDDEQPGEPDPEQWAQAEQGPRSRRRILDAFYTLLEHAGTYKPESRHRFDFRTIDLEDALTAVAEDVTLVGPAQRYFALRKLANINEGLPRYRTLRDQYAKMARVVVDSGGDGTDSNADRLVELIHNRDPNDDDALNALLSDHVRAQVALADQCTPEVVSAADARGHDVESLWLFCEFESTTDFAVLTDWLNPETWPPRGPLLFESVTLEPPGWTKSSGGRPGRYATIREVANFHGIHLDTLLDCSYFETEGVATLTYDLNQSKNGRLKVDRGYLSVRDIGENRRMVRCLKIVAFTDLDESTLDAAMCPWWTLGVREAAEAKVPTTGAVSVGEASATSTGAGPAFDFDAVAGKWQAGVAESAEAYSDLAMSVARSVMDGKYDAAACQGHTTTLWTNLARDWARAWVGSYEVAEQLANTERGDPKRDPTGFPGPPCSVAVTTPVPKLAKAARAAASDLVGIGTNDVRIPAAALDVAPEPVPAGKDDGEVIVTAALTNQPAGMYVGRLDLPVQPGTPIPPILLYVTRATKAHVKV